jgi:hypothetical protein
MNQPKSIRTGKAESGILSETFKMGNNNYVEVIILILLICLNFIIDIQNSGKIKDLTKEDGIVEMFTAISYFLTACLLFYLFIISKSDNNKYFLRTKRNLFFLFFGLLCILFAGEEISWGQRIFNIENPDFFQKYNRQHELNLHNLSILHGSKSDFKMKTGIALLLSSNALLYEFYVFFFFLIPLLNRFSKKIRSVLEGIYFPVLPLWIGITFLLNYVICEIIERAGLIGYYEIGEIKEANFPVLFFIAFLSLYKGFVNCDRSLKNSRLEK